ncbi:hypothetical protein KY312_02760 [Candidatus Woesearchaeota archaeon]|nr:hypothetical protein [Candidatus Woesearchaeota archaeon]
MKKILLFVLMILLVPSVFSAMDPARGFCEHQDYVVDSGFYENGTAYYFCVFDSENRCDMNDFFRGKCGAEFRKAFRCREEGEIVFSQFEECCNGMKPYLPTGWEGQASCQKFSNRFISEIKHNPFYWFVIAVIVVGMLLLVTKFLKKK